MPNACSFAVNCREYHPADRPYAMVCLDGTSDDYLDAALVRGRMPRLQRIILNGVRARARAAMPTFTNVNNTGIVTGCPPSMHGICGNYFLDSRTGEEVMMNSAKYLRCSTLFPAAQRAGRRVAVVTAKEKLRDIFAHELIGTGGIAFSSEKAAAARKETHGIDDVESLAGPTPAIYSGDASLYVLKAGVELLRAGRADFLYLSTTDYIQHAHAPEEPEALEFLTAVDRELGRLEDAGAVIGLTADHGMNAKQNPAGEPQVIYLENAIWEAFEVEARVILPITDPYVVHHGALGSFAMIYLPPELEGPPMQRSVQRWLQQTPGITEVYGRSVAAQLLELPADRIGDLVVISGRNTVLGRAPAHHDLTALHGGLRSHGGRHEEMVPFIFSKPLRSEFVGELNADPRNFDLFHHTLNGTLV